GGIELDKKELLAKDGYSPQSKRRLMRRSTMGLEIVRNETAEKEETSTVKDHLTPNLLK
ncbi:hypothetical protein HHI36_010658, partial [Cryptolaemus montrouzieri]